MESIVKTVGLDLAKDTFHVFCADAEGNRVQSKKLRRNQVLPYFEELGAQCTVAMETCTGANWWCRRLRDLGYDARRIAAWHKAHEESVRLEGIPGVGVLTASYLAATLGDGSAYRNGRQFAASLGLVPRQNSTGGKQKLGAITKRGDPLLRGLLYEGAFALLCRRLRDGGKDFPRTARFVANKPFRVAVVAWANRNARTAWSMIRHGTEYEEKSEISREVIREG